MIGAIEKSSTSATSAVCALVFAKPSFVAIRGKADLLQYVCNMQTDEKITTAKATDWRRRRDHRKVHCGG